jgi:hypothetical protein
MKARFVHYLVEFLERPEPMFQAPDRSTVCGQSLIDRYGLPLPLFPSYETWITLVAAKKRCGRCNAALRGGADLANHYQNTNCGLWAKQKKAVAA